MKLSVRNFRNIERADIEGGPITLIGGKNKNGKSSVLMAMALAATGWALPAGRNKKDAGKMVRRGADKGKVSAFVGEGAVTVSYPKAEVAFEGEIKISTIAAGLHRLSDMRADEMSTALGRFIGADPTLADLIECCRDANLSAEWAGKVWSKLESDGWEKAFQQAKDNGIKLKTMWETKTGQKKWGAKLAEGWSPANWLPEFETLTIEESEVIELRQRLQKAREDAAVDTATMERLEDEAGKVAGYQGTLQEAQAEQQQAEAAVAKATADLAALPRPDAPGGEMPCPHCGGFLKWKRLDDGVNQLVPVEEETPLSAAELKKQREAIAGAEGAVANARNALGNAKGRVLDAQVALTRANAAAKELEAARSKSGGEDTGALASELADLELKFVAIETKREAGKLHKLIGQNAALQELLKPEGLRRTVMNRGLEAFNDKTLAPLCIEAGWPPVRITPDMSITWGEDDWIDLDAGSSSRWIVDRIIQMAIAKLDGSKLVIMDGADICDSGNRNKLFGLLLNQPFEALVGMTYNKPELMPDLPSMQAGKRYWITSGIAKEV